MPAIDDDLRKKLDNKEIVLGGCCVTECDPTHYCNKCKKAFGAPTIEAETATVKVHFSVGGFFGGYPDITVSKTADGALAEYTPSRISNETSSNRKLEVDEWLCFVHRLFACHIADWKKRYFDPNVLDGTQWELEVSFATGKPLKIYGSNQFPPHWKKLLKTINELGFTAMK